MHRSALDELEIALTSASSRAALPPTPAIAWPLLARAARRRGGGQAREPHPTGAFKVRGGLTFVDALKRRAAAAPGDRLGDARQPRPEPRLRRRARRPGGDDLRAARQFAGEERGDARARRRAGRARRRLPGGARGGDAARGRAACTPCPPSIAISCSASRPMRWSCCARVPDLDVALRADRPGLGHLRLHRGARRAGAEDRDRRRAGERRARLRAVLRRRPRVATRRAATRSPTAWRRAFPTTRRSTSSRAGAARVVPSSTTTRSPRRSAPIGPTRTISPKAPARRRSPRAEERERLRRRKVGLVLSGGNIDLELFQRWAAPA